MAACSVDAGERTWARERLGVTALYDSYEALLRDLQVQAIAKSLQSGQVEAVA